MELSSMQHLLYLQDILVLTVHGTGNVYPMDPHTYGDRRHGMEGPVISSEKVLYVDPKGFNLQEPRETQTTNLPGDSPNPENIHNHPKTPRPFFVRTLHLLTSVQPPPGQNDAHELQTGGVPVA